MHCHCRLQHYLEDHYRQPQWEIVPVLGGARLTSELHSLWLERQGVMGGAEKRPNFNCTFFPGCLLSTGLRLRELGWVVGFLHTEERHP